MRSTFVTVVAWIFIVLAGFSTFISILQNVMLDFMFPMQPMNVPSVDPRTGKELPAVVLFLFNHFQLFFLGFLVASATTFVAAVGLLKRMNWARLLFMAIMGIGIAWNVGGLLLMIPFHSMFTDVSTASGQPDFSRRFELVWTIVAVANALFVVAFVGLFGWIIKRLASEEVRREFSARSGSGDAV